MGDLVTWRRGDLVGFPMDALNQHIVLLGATGSGKTETMLRLAYGARKCYGYQVCYFDAKGDQQADTPARFIAAMRAAGARSIRMFPATFYNGWRGSARDLYNRLMAVIDYSESRYYGDVAADVVRLALNSPAGVPRSSGQLLSLMSFKGLVATYKGSPQMATIASLDKKLLNQVAMRYRVFFNAVEGQLDGSLGYEDADAMYVQIKGFTLRDEAPRLGRFLVLDFAHYLAERKPRGVRTLLLIDEVNALRVRDEMSILFEQARSFGAGIAISSQSYAGLGPREYAERMLGAANTFILHQCSDPEEIAKRAGRIPIVRSNWGVTMGAATGHGRMQLYEDWKVHPDRVRQQQRGEAFIINAGHAQQLRFAPVSLPPAAMADAQRLIQQEEAAQQALLVQAAQQAQAQSAQAAGSTIGSPTKSATTAAGPKAKKAPQAPANRQGQPGAGQKAPPATNAPVQDGDDEADRIS
jgi:hypothetical protein